LFDRCGIDIQACRLAGFGGRFLLCAWAPGIAASARPNTSAKMDRFML